MRTSVELNHHYLLHYGPHLDTSDLERQVHQPPLHSQLYLQPGTAPTNTISVVASALSFVLASVLLISYHVTLWHCLELIPWPFPCVRLSHWSFSRVSPKPSPRPWSGASPCLSLWPRLFSVPDPIPVMGPDPGSALMSVYAASPNPMSVLPMSLSLSLTLPLFQALSSLSSWSRSRCRFFYLWPHCSPICVSVSTWILAFQGFYATGPGEPTVLHVCVCFPCSKTPTST